MAKPNYSFEKRQRELAKKKKKEEKEKEKAARKVPGAGEGDSGGEPTEVTVEDAATPPAGPTAA